jgi:hypothetical protein
MSKKNQLALGASDVQQDMEKILVGKLERSKSAKERKWPELAHDLDLDNVWCRVQPDGCWESHSGGKRIITIVEAYARVTKLLSGNRSKLCKDALKLGALRSAVNDQHPEIRVRCILAVPSELSSELSRDRNSWMNQAIHQVVEVEPIKLTKSQSERLRAAQEAQRR